MAADYSFWEMALTGHIGNVFEDEPQPGYYRLRSNESSGKRGPKKFLGAKAVAIFEHEGKIIASIDGMLAENPSELFLMCCKYPVSEADYRAHRNGFQWPDLGESK